MASLSRMFCALLATVPLRSLSLQMSSWQEPQTLQQTLSGKEVSQLTIKDLQAFVEAQPEKEASLVLIGDSTVRGLVGKLTSLTESRSVYRSVDLVNYVGEHVHKEFQDERTRKAQEKAMRSYRALHGHNCTLSGALEVHVFDKELDGLVLYHWEFIPEYGDACYKPCLVEGAKELKPTALLWNVGLHLLSVHYDSSSCSREHGKNHQKLNCGNYEELVSMGLSGFAKSTKQLLFRTTNSVCWKKIGFKPDWHDPVKRKELEATCHRECSAFGESDNCSDWVLDEHSTGLQYEQAMRAIKVEQEKAMSAGTHSLHVLDGYAATLNNCDASKDGVHFGALDGQLGHELAKILVQSK